MVTNGVIGETCTNFYPNTTQLWCTYATIPDCVDRTINCTMPPLTEAALIEVFDNTDPNNIREYQTSLQYSCTEKQHYFDYPVGNTFKSYYYTTNINSINVTCNQDG